MKLWRSQLHVCTLCRHGFSPLRGASTRFRPHNQTKSVSLATHLSSRRTSYRAKHSDEQYQSAQNVQGGLPTRERRGKLQKQVTDRWKPAGHQGSSLYTARVEKSPIGFGQDVMRRLASVKRMLEEPDRSNKEDTSQLQSLDPEGDLWPKFEESVRALVGVGDICQQKALPRSTVKTLRLQLQECWKGTALAKMERHLHFAFVDYTFEENPALKTRTISRRTDLRFPTEWYTDARSMQRIVHLHVGPTNSGKTYNALKRLEEAQSGFYAGPLRLLAHEVWSRFKSKGKPCDLVTGDDIRRDVGENVAMTSSTVEMVDTSTEVEVAVIDEIQMIADEERGHAWTRAFLGAFAKEVHVCGEARVVPLIRELAASTGDSLHIHRYERLSPLKAANVSLRSDLKNLRKGDCVVAFSVITIHALKAEIELATGRRVAIVYGSLPPETRARQAELFNDPGNDYDYLVASNAIGMGLNLAIKRVVFQAISKYNGMYNERLSIADIKQIAGRAGRYRSAFQDKQSSGHTVAPTSQERKNEILPTGFVTTLHEDDLSFVQGAMQKEPDPITVARVLPPLEIVEEYAGRLPKGLPFEYVMSRLLQDAALHPRYKLCDVRGQLEAVQVIDKVEGLTPGQRYMICLSPAENRLTSGQKVSQALAKAIANKKPTTIADIPEIPLEILEQPMSGKRDYLSGLEALHKAIIQYLWLSYRFQTVFKDQAMAMHAKELVEQKINTTLVEFSANPKLRKSTLQHLKSFVKPDNAESKPLSGSKSAPKKEIPATVVESVYMEEKPSVIPTDLIDPTDVLNELRRNEKISVPFPEPKLDVEKQPQLRLSAPSTQQRNQ